MKVSPAALLLILIALGGGAAVWLTSHSPSTALIESKASDAESLRQQVGLLQGQIEYLQGQVDVLQDENAALLQKLGSLGLKNTPLAKMADEGVSPDFVGMGVDMMRFRKIQSLPLVTTPVPESAVEEAVLKWLRKTQPDDHAQRFSRAITSLGWIPDAVDPLPLQAKLLTRQLGGWYDEVSDTMLTVDAKTDPPPSAPPDEAIAISFGQLLREYGPVLFQPQLGTLSTDERLARESLLAGDAGLTRFLFSLQEPKAAPRDSAFPADDPDHPLNQIPVPNLLREMALFPFSRGFEFAQALHSAGQFTQVNTAYSRPPASTSEIIEPESYLEVSAESPPKPELGPLEAKLAGESPFWDDTLGRFICLTILRSHNEDEHAALASAGLIADRLLAWDAGKEATRHHAAWQTLFKDADFATAFLKAMSRVMHGRFQLKEVPGEPTDVRFEQNGRYLQLIKNRDGKGVLLIEAGSAAARDEMLSVLQKESKRP